MRYGSTASGIEAPTVAWHPLGWESVFFSEIEKFPSAVLAHHYPDVPNFGDLNGYKDWNHGTIDLLVGGTPCQSFSVAGLRKGMADPRGNLALVFLGLVDRARPRWVVWENVPGVLSSNGGRDFGAFVGALGELRYGWAYRVLDAQYFGVPQRRRRVFVVGYLGDWRPAAAVLFERHSLLRNPPPGRTAGAEVAHSLASSPGGCNDPNRAGAFVVNALTSTGVGTCGADDNQAQAGHLLCMATGQGSAEIVRDGSPSLTCNHEAPIVAAPVTCRPYADNSSKETQLIAHTLRGSAFDASEDGTGRGTPIVPVAVRTANTGANGHRIAEDVAHTLDRAMGQAVAFHHQNSASCGMGVSDICPSLQTDKEPAVAHAGMAVRRLTPRECERLQGFPDDYTLVTIRGKPAADGPRYKALGNSMAVPVMRWLGKRIDAVNKIIKGRYDTTTNNEQMAGTREGIF